MPMILSHIIPPNIVQTPAIGVENFILSQSENTAINFLDGQIYNLYSDLTPKSGQIWDLRGSTLRVGNSIATSISGIINSSSTVYNVASASGFIVGMDVSISQNLGTDFYIFTPSSRRIIAINGNQIQLDRSFGSAFSSYASANATNTSPTTMDSANGTINFFTSPIPIEYRNAAGRIGAVSGNVFTKLSSVTIKNGTVDGNLANNPFLRRWESCANLDLGVDNLRISNLDCINSRGEGIVLSGRNIQLDSLRFINISGNGSHLSDWDTRPTFDGANNVVASNLIYDNVNTIARLGTTRGIGHDDGAFANSINISNVVVQGMLVEGAIGAFNFEVRAFNDPITDTPYTTASAGGESRMTLTGCRARKLSRFPFEAFIGGAAQAQDLIIANSTFEADMSTWNLGSAGAPNCPTFNIGVATNSVSGYSYAKFNNVIIRGFQPTFANISDLSLTDFTVHLPRWTTGNQLSYCMILDNCKITNSSGVNLIGGFYGIILRSSFGADLTGGKMGIAGCPSWSLIDQAGNGLSFSSTFSSLASVDLSGMKISTSSAAADYVPQSNYYGIDAQLARNWKIGSVDISIAHAAAGGGCVRLSNNTTSGSGVILEDGKHIMLSTAPAAGVYVLPAGGVGNVVRNTWSNLASTLSNTGYPAGNTISGISVLSTSIS